LFPKKELTKQRISLLLEVVSFALLKKRSLLGSVYEKSKNNASFGAYQKCFSRQHQEKMVESFEFLQLYDFTVNYHISCTPR
jgi:5-methylcytosine-specific restriction endonuclease McrBC regulatory subunit McrC